MLFATTYPKDCLYADKSNSPVCVACQAGFDRKTRRSATGRHLNPCTSTACNEQIKIRQNQSLAKIVKEPKKILKNHSYICDSEKHYSLDNDTY